MQDTQQIPDWFRLDNAAKIFPAVDSSRSTTMFRLSATLHEPISPDILQRAVDNITPRFPYFQVKLRAGMFWHYLQRVNDSVLVQKEEDIPCSTITARKGKKLLYRVLYYNKKISVEFSHIITDGAGGLEYCKSVVAEYLRIKGVDLPEWGDIMRPGQTISPEEFEDSYRRFNDESIPPPPHLERAFQLPDPMVGPDYFRIMTGILPIEPLLAISRESRVSLTEYLAAQYILSLYEHLMDFPRRQQRTHLRPIRLVIPVNARKIFSSKTMRNFVLHVTPGIDPRLGTYTFEEVLNQVHHFMRVELNEKFIKQQIARNMRGETMPIIRITPLFVKIPVERILFQKYGNTIASGVLSNLGAVTIPKELQKHIERFEFITVPNYDTGLSIGAISYLDKLYITVGSLIESRDIQRRFFTSIRKLGVPVKIETNG